MVQNGTTNDNEWKTPMPKCDFNEVACEWQGAVQQTVSSGRASDNGDSEWYSEWQQVILIELNPEVQVCFPKMQNTYMPN